MRIVIFGCGIVAKKTYGFLGAERVDFSVTTIYRM